MNRRKVVFVTGTRADFGKIKSLIEILRKDDGFEVHIFATGMHMNAKYGKTINEIHKCGFDNIFPYYNHADGDPMESIVAQTIIGFSHFVQDTQPDLIIVHGDRSEALAGAIVGSFNNILVGHIEGGEESGTIDELIRHSVSKLSHIHFVSNEQSKKNLIQMGEDPNSIHVIGSPDIDIMNSAINIDINFVKNYYDIPFDSYAIAMFHPVTTEYDTFSTQAKEFVDALLESDDNYIVVYPNNDRGSEFIFDEYKRLEGVSNICLFPSLRFEYFLKLLSETKYIIGNSSAGIREAPYYGVPSIDIGSRQNNRYQKGFSITHSAPERTQILKSIHNITNYSFSGESVEYGDGQSDIIFYQLIKSKTLFRTNIQKSFIKLSIR